MKINDYKSNINKLELLIKSMRLPRNKKTIKSNDGIRWLSRNIKIENAEHPNVEDVLHIIKSLIRIRQ